MTQREDFLSDADLDTLFADAQSDAPVPSDAFMARVLADADSVQEASGAGLPDWARSKPAQPVRKSWFANLLDSVGGWRGGAGLATATVMGLAIGLGAPTTVTDLASGTWGGTAVAQSAGASIETTSYALDDLVPSFYDLAAEG
ncbi:MULTISPECIES: dihydroorotate dehydrogenase [Pacificibacter]|uniref:dihydroorotate dehydrogenase n=1 Tax=Pacificibacter TaxID=1042323 RepID=UPI001C0A507C|nr:MULTISPECIES: dihydroorotate dehydrogenase [Pacificibacter]MBU2937437.1 dihydroorotate dehydrogenase [Pacificibacter marinus]MDO6615616.1 dihydroorotate dehydrogenase [Pacificibacter sp. 1_MG-2023]